MIVICFLISETENVDLIFRLSSEIGSDDKYPLTIFYNETVAVFHVSRDEVSFIQTISSSFPPCTEFSLIILPNFSTKIEFVE